MKVEATTNADPLPRSDNPLERAEEQADAAAMARKRTGTEAPAVAASTPQPKAPAGHGPHNNWGQVPAYRKVEPPSDYDHKRPKTPEAPLGYLSDGRPWSPYGVRKTSGKPRLEPKPSMKGRDENVPAGGAGATTGPTQRRLAPGEQKVPAEVQNLHNAFDDWYDRGLELHTELKKRHPETRYGRPVHPRDLGSGELVRATPVIGAPLIAYGLTLLCAFLSNLVGRPDLKPEEAAIKETATAIADASRYYGLDMSPKAQATWTALIAVGMLTSPYIGEGVKRAFGKNDAAQEGVP
jgi:hypothetical protein